MPLEIYEDDDTTLVADLVIPNVEAGGGSDVVTLHVWNDKGNGAGQARSNVRLVDQVEDPGDAGVFVSSGLPPVDQRWIRGKISGFDNTGDPTWAVAATDWMPLGAFASQLLPTIPPNCAIYIDRKVEAPSGAAQTTWRFGITIFGDEFSAPVPAQLTDVDRGIFHAVGNFTDSHLVRGGAVTATGTPDEFVNIAAAEVVYKGRLYGAVATQLELDQNDGGLDALIVTESYIAALSWGPAGWRVTKGTKGVSPVAPAIPAGDIPARKPYATVGYQAGASVIETADLSGEGFYGRFHCEAGSGRQVRIHPHALGAIAGGTWRYATSVQLVDDLTASDTSFLWQLANGHWEATLTEEPPETTAAGPWFEVDCDGSGVTDIRDRRTYAGKSKELVLRGAYPAGSAPQLIDDVVIDDADLDLELVVVRQSDNGGGSSGAAQYDVKVNGTTVFTDFATDDQRPSIAFDASTADLIQRDAIAQVRRLRRGDVVSFHTVADPTGGDPARVECHLICRVP